MIRIWQSYACNNSSAYRLVARFADAATATATGAELRILLAELEDESNSGFQAMARVYGLGWGDGGYGGPEDGPHVIVDGNTLIVHHDYCLGIGPGVPAYLTEHGATVDKENWADVHVSVMFRAPIGADPQLDDEVAALIAQLAGNVERVVEPFNAPWVHENTRGRIAFFRDAGTVGLFFPIDARDLAAFKAWLAAHAIEKSVFRIEAYADQDLFVALAAARCTACQGALEYLDPRLHDIEVAQLMCKPCGGLYELSTFLQETA